jgi:hypothetical protein
MSTDPRGLWKDAARVMPSVAALLLPKCPYCFLALAALLDTLGIDSATYQRAFLPVLVVLLSFPVLLLGLCRTGASRVQTMVLMIIGAALYVSARLEEWPVAFQVVAAALYCLGAFKYPRQKRCCSLQTPPLSISLAAIPSGTTSSRGPPPTGPEALGASGAGCRHSPQRPRGRSASAVKLTPASNV